MLTTGTKMRMRALPRVAAALWVLGGAGCAGPMMTAETQGPSAIQPVRGISVSGSGKASGRPDVVRTSVGVEVRAATADEAITEANALMAKVIDALKKAEIAERDLRTTTVSLDFEPRPEPAPPVEMPTPSATGKTRGAVRGPAARGNNDQPTIAPSPGPRGVYRAVNMVEVTVRKLERIGQIVTAATSAGANQLHGIQFQLEDRAPVEKEARRKAYDDARARAQQLAQIAGLRLGPPLSITEGTGDEGGRPELMMMKRDLASVPVERGELTVTTNISVVFALPE